jgi:hypothetical protein
LHLGHIEIVMNLSVENWKILAGMGIGVFP